jgi:hypothetical protein
MQRITQCVARKLDERPKKLLQWPQGRLVASAMLSRHAHRERSIVAEIACSLLFPEFAKRSRRNGKPFWFSINREIFGLECHGGGNGCERIGDSNGCWRSEGGVCATRQNDQFILSSVPHLGQMKPAVGTVSSTKYKRSRWITTGAKAKE